MGKKAPHDVGFCLCDRHHDELHDTLGKREWERRYGSQREIWERVKAAMGG